MKSILRLLLAILIVTSSSFAQTHPNAEAKRFTRGVPGDLAAFQANASLYQSAVIPADQQRGIALNATGNNATLYGNAPESQLPWFCRIQRTQRYHLTADQSGALAYAAIENPIAVFGENGGATPLYLNRDYRFGVFAGFRDYTNAGNPLRGIFRIRAYSAAALSSGQANVAHAYETTFELPWPGDANWNQFLLDGGRKVVDWTQTGLKTTIELVGSAVAQGNPEQWNTWNDPFVVTHRASNSSYYFVVEYQGFTVAGVTNYPMVSSVLPATTSTATYSPLYTLDFTSQPPWRSTFLHAPQFAGEPVPSWYYGKSFEELQAAWMFVPSTPGDALKAATTVDHSAELRSHPLLDDFVTSMGSDPIALANYVFNEIELTDPVSYNEDGGMDEASIHCGGLNRSALATFLEKQGNPWEQCALLVYLLRKANVAAVYCEPDKDKLGMLDTQLSKLLRMQIKGAKTPEGLEAMPQIVPTNYPWVSAWIPGEGRWVHLFPWLKDTEVNEGGNLYDQFPAVTKTGAAWVRKYLQADASILPDQTGAYQQDSGTNGLVVIEAEGYHEHVPKGGKRWEPLTEKDENGVDSPAGYSGTAWVRAMPNTGTALTSSGFASQSPRLDYQIDFNRSGTHYVWLRGQGANSNDNTVHVGLNGAEVSTASNVGGFGTTFGWTNRNTSNAVLAINVPSAGRHTLNVWMRQDGFRLDKLVLNSSPESSFTPLPDGVIALEAEAFAENVEGAWYYGPGSPAQQFIPRWEVVAGQGLMQTSSAVGSNSASGPAALKYNVAIPSSATYTVWLYGKADTGSKTAGVSLDGNTGTATFTTTLAWKSAGQIASGAGTKVLSLNRQADGVSVDKLLVVLDSAYTPSGTGLAATPLSKQSAVESNVPSNLFARYARTQLAASNTSFDDLGIKFRDRRYYRTAWDDFPRPFNLYPGSHVFFEKLADRADTFDTVRVQLWSDRNNNGTYEAGSDGPKLDTGDWLSTDLHNRRFYTSARKTGTNTHQLRLHLAPYRAGTSGTGNYAGTNKLQEQLLTANLTSADDTLQFEITHRRQKKATKFGLASVQIGNAGTGYTNPPTVNIAPPPAGTGHRPALATAYVSAGQVFRIVLTDPGYGYTTAPSVTFTPNGGGTGAAATAVLQDGVRWVHPLGISVRQLVTQKPTIRKGELAALCLNFGRVTDNMLRAQAEDFWGLERSLSATPSLKEDANFQEQMQSTSAYLMGMAYYNRVSRFKETDERLHKARVFSMYAAGLSKLAPYRNPELAASSPATLGFPNDGDIIPQMATVDMFFLNAAYAANGTVHPDSGVPFTESTRDFWHLLIAEISAQEHGIINDYYRESAAISTIKLLHRAKTVGIRRLTKANHASEGAINYTYGATTKTLSNWDTQMWQAITDTFNGAGGDLAEVFITPGPVASASASYTGMGAMVFANDLYSALISGNMNLSNGGAGSLLYAPIYSAPQLPRITLLSTANDYSIGYRAPASASNPFLAPSSTNIFRSLDTITGLNSLFYTPTTYQSLSWNNNAALYGLPTGGTGTYYSQTVSRGSTGSTSFFGAFESGLSSLVGAVADPVSVITGEFHIDAVDLTLPGPMPLSIRRNYSSQALSDNEFGHGWKLAYFPYLVVGDNGLIYGAEMDGSVIAYRQDAGNPNLYTPKTDDNPSLRNVHDGGAGSTGNAMNNRLVKSIEGADTIYTLTGPHGHTRRFKVRSFPVGTITRSRPYLDTWKDAHGNTLTFTFYGTSTDFRYGQLKQIAANNGNFVGFDYDVFGHIVEAWTGDGRRVKYTCDSQGDLRTVTLPDGAVHAYDYEQETSTAGGESVLTSKHLLTQETKPDGRILVNLYDTQRRVIEQKAVVDSTTTAPVTNATFTYANSQNATTKAWTGTTTVRDAYNRATVFAYTDSLVTSEDDPETAAEVREWYPANATPGSNGAYPRSLKQITDRRGVVTFFKYDARGNLIEKSVGTIASPADLDGDGIASAGEKAVTTWSCNSLDLPLTQTDPSGVVTMWFYENASYPYLATRIEKHAQAQLVSKVVRTFYAKTGTPSAFGLLQSERVAADSADEARTDWLHDQRGYATQRTQLSGTGDPNIVTTLLHNGRGELIEEADSLGRKWRYTYDAMGRRTAAERRDGAGALVSWDYVYYNRNGEVEWADGPRFGPEDYVWHRYDGHGRRTEEIRWRSQAKGDGTGVEAGEGDDLVSTTFFKYDKFNNLVESRSPRRHSVTMAYDGIGRLTGRSFYEGYFGAGGALKASESFTYEPGGEVATHTGVLGGQTTMLYNARGQLRRRTNADGSVEEWRYYGDGRIYREILRNGSYWETTYDDLNRTITRVLKTSGGTVLKTQVKAHDRRGNCISETADGFTFTRTYDDLDRPKTVTGPAATATSAQQTTTYTYPDGAGREARVTNGLGETTITLRDALGRVESVEVRDAGNAVVRKTTYAYSTDHHQTTGTEGTGAGAIVTQTWTDTFGNPVLVKKADGTAEYSFYDSGGLLVDHFDRALRETFYARNWHGDVTQEVRPGGVVVNYVTDAAGNILQRNMPGGLSEQALFDTAGRQTQSKLVQGGNTTRLVNFAYHPAGHPWVGLLNTATDARGIVTTTSYDGALRVAGQVSTGPDPEDAVSRTLGYNERDQLTSVAETGLNGATTVARSFDGYGAIGSEIVSIGGVAQSSLTQSWNAAGRRSQLDGAGASRTFAYRADGLMLNTATSGSTYAASYGDHGLLAARTSPFRSAAVQTRDTLGRITDLRTTVGGVLALKETVPQWNSLDKVQGVYATRAGTGAWNENRDYLYDNSGRLIYEDYVPYAAFGEDYTLTTYDGATWGASATGGIGVRAYTQRWSDGVNLHAVPGVATFARVTSEQVGGSQPRAVPLSGAALGAKTVSLTLDGHAVGGVSFPGWQDTQGLWSATGLLAPGYHALTATATHPSGWVAAPAASSFYVQPRAETVSNTYDEMGNVASRSWSLGKAQTLTWDGRGRLLKVVQTGVTPFTWTALYDGLNRRVSTTYTPNGGAAVVASSVFDPEVEFLELGLSISGAQAWKVYGPDLSGSYGGLQGLGGLEAIVGSDGITRGIVNDWNGNTVGHVAAPGTALTWSSAQFLAFGPAPGWSTAPLDGTKPLHELLGYRGLTLDPPGYVQQGLRPYDPQTGRWLSPDPLGHSGSLSLYDYCDNDPVNRFDPDGRFGKGVSSGWNGNIAANAPNSAAFNVGTMFGGTSRGGVDGLGIGVQNVSGYTSYQEHVTVFEGDKWAAGNAAWNPAYMAMRGFTEAGTGSGLQPGNLGQTLTTGQRVWSGVEGTLGVVGTVSAGAGVARVGTISGITAPAENFAARTYLNAVGKSEFYSSFSPGTARLNVEIGGRQLFRAANTEGAAAFGEFASVQRPGTPLQAVQGNALNPTITTNRATNLFQVETRFGLSVEGTVAPQGVGFPGGNTQIFQAARPGLPTWSSTLGVPYLGVP